VPAAAAVRAGGDLGAGVVVADVALVVFDVLWKNWPVGLSTHRPTLAPCPLSTPTSVTMAARHSEA
jgi:hypothetical protein